MIDPENRPRWIVIDETSAGRSPPALSFSVVRFFFCLANAIAPFPLAPLFFPCLNIYVCVSFHLPPSFCPLLLFPSSRSTHRCANDDSPCNRRDRCNHDFVHRLQLANAPCPLASFTGVSVPRSK